jgi:hypothetical protein
MYQLRLLVAEDGKNTAVLTGFIDVMRCPAQAAAAGQPSVKRP